MTADALHQDIILEQLRTTWRKYPYMRLCQLIVNVTNRDDPFYVEDGDLVTSLADYDPSTPTGQQKRGNAREAEERDVVNRGPDT